MTVYLAKGSLIRITTDASAPLNAVSLSEHSRSPAALDYTPTRIMDRTIVGTLRRQSINYKRKLSLSWEWLPALDSQTLDGKAGRNTLKALLDNDWLDTNWTTNLNNFTIYFNEVNSSNVQTEVSFQAVVDEYSEQLMKRYAAQHWNISVSFIEA